MGIRCRACRRYILNWTHYLVLALLGLIAAWLLLELFFIVERGI